MNNICGNVRDSTPKICIACYVFSVMASKMNESNPPILMLSPSGEADSKIFVKRELTGERETFKIGGRGSKFLEGQ